MTRFILSWLALLLAASVGPASADETPRISLITFPPRSDLSGAFGHAVLRIDADGDLATTADQALYDYGVWSMEDMQAAFSDWRGLAHLVTDLLDGEMEAEIRVRRGPEFQSPAERLYEDAQEDVLALDREILRRIRRDIEAKFAPGARRTYVYRHYTRNCATEIRDDILGSISGIRRALESQAEGSDASLRLLLAEDLDAAVARHGRLTIASGFWRDNRAVFTVAGVPESIDSTPAFFAMARRLSERMALLSLSEDRARIRDAWSSFERNLDRAPLSRWEAAYTPARLRALLVREGLLESR